MSLKMWAGIMVFGLVAAVVAMLALTKLSPPVSAAILVADACTNVRNVQSLKLISEVSQLDGMLMTKATTVIRKEGPHHRHVVSTTDKGEREEAIHTEDATFFRSREADVWVRLPRPTGPPTEKGPSISHSFCGYQGLTAIGILGPEILDGKEILRVTARTDMEKKASIIFPPDTAGNPAREQFVLGEETVDFWIDQQAGLPVQIRQVASFPKYEDEEAYSFDVLARYSDFNRPMGIKAVERYVDAEQP